MSAKSEQTSFVFANIKSRMHQAISQLKHITNVESVTPTPAHLEVSIKHGVEDYSFVPQQLISAGFKLTMLKEEEVNLETAFMRLTKGMVQ